MKKWLIIYPDSNGEFEYLQIMSAEKPTVKLITKITNGHPDSGYGYFDPSNDFVISEFNDNAWIQA